MVEGKVTEGREAGDENPQFIFSPYSFKNPDVNLLLKFIHMMSYFKTWRSFVLYLGNIPGEMSEEPCEFMCNLILHVSSAGWFIDRVILTKLVFDVWSSCVARSVLRLCLWIRLHDSVSSSVIPNQGACAPAGTSADTCVYTETLDGQMGLTNEIKHPLF